MEASYYTKLDNNNVRCKLCPQNCHIKENDVGLCGVRRNLEGNLVTDVYNRLSALAPDPIEKKPLYHFYPGSNILSAGSFGCNMSCKFCQNYDISQVSNEAFLRTSNYITAGQIINTARDTRNNIGIAFTYNEPVVWFEFMRDIAILARENKQATVMVSNGYVNPGPLKEICEFIDAFNIDLKSSENDFYRKQSGASLRPVLETLSKISKSGRHLEVTTLVIPGLNDSKKIFTETVKIIAGTSGRNTVLHISRYFPRYKSSIPPTSETILLDLCQLAAEHLDYVYAGNLSSKAYSNTNCPACGIIITKRSGYHTENINSTNEGMCNKCGEQIYNHFTSL